MSVSDHSSLHRVKTAALCLQGFEQMSKLFTGFLQGTQSWKVSGTKQKPSAKHYMHVVKKHITELDLKAVANLCETCTG